MSLGRVRREPGGLCLCGEKRIGLCDACETALVAELEDEDAEWWVPGVPEPDDYDEDDNWWEW